MIAFAAIAFHSETVLVGLPAGCPRAETERPPSTAATIAAAAITAARTRFEVIVPPLSLVGLDDPQRPLLGCYEAVTGSKPTGREGARSFRFFAAGGSGWAAPDPEDALAARRTRLGAIRYDGSPTSEASTSLDQTLMPAEAADIPAGGARVRPSEGSIERAADSVPRLCRRRGSTPPLRSGEEQRSAGRAARSTR